MGRFCLNCRIGRSHEHPPHHSSRPRVPAAVLARGVLRLGCVRDSRLRGGAMTPHSQLIEHDPANGMHGDCQRTCVAVILDLHPSDVPHFCDDPTATRSDANWWARRQDEWLAGRGLTAATFAYSGDASLDDVMLWTSRQNPTTPMILLGQSSLGCNHVVVVLNGEIVCDPSGNGIVGPSLEGTWEVSLLSVADQRAPAVKP